MSDSLKSRKKWSYIPIEISREILSYLPVESLLRFRCVSDKWRRLIEEDSDFINLHLRRQSDRTLLICTGSKLYNLSFDSITDSISGLSTVEASRIKSFKNAGGPRITLPFPSCDGLVLYADCYHYVVKNAVKKIWTLWNPFTREFLDLPSYDHIFHTKPGGTMVYGLGYDAVNNDYKVVRLMFFDPDCGPASVETLVYSLKSDKWKRIEDFFGLTAASFGAIGVFVNGAMHCMVYLHLLQGHRKNILAFNITTETYRLLELPSDFAEPEGFSHLGVLDGCLFLGYYNKWGFDGWKMNDYGGEDIWTKMFSFKLPANFVNWTPGYYLMNEEQVLINYDDIFAWFDIGEENAKKVTCMEVNNKRSVNACRSQVVTASLIRLNGSGRARKIITSEVKTAMKRNKGPDRLNITLTTRDLQLPCGALHW